MRSSGSAKRAGLAAAVALLLAVPAVAAPQVEAGAPAPAPAAAPLRQRAELTHLRTENTETYVEPDGKHTLVAHPAPVRTRRGDDWTPINTNLRRTKDGTVRPGATVTDLVLSGGGDRAMVGVGVGKNRLRLTWPTVLPKPVLDGDTATYPEVYPGVDLKLRAEVDGVAQVLVVKNRAAAERLRTIDVGLTATGLTVRVRPDGSTVAVDNKNRTVLSGDRAVMWDSNGAPAAVRSSGAQESRRAVMSTVRTESGLRVVPDRKLLTAATTKYPVYIDPPWSTGHQFWSHVNQMADDQSYWNYDRAEGAKVGYSWDYAVRYRSFFQFDTTKLAGSRIVAAGVRIVLDHSPSGTATPADLWATRAIDPSVPLKWNNSEGHWLHTVAQASGNAWTGHQPDQEMVFTSPQVKSMVQNIATGRGATATFGLRAPDEGNRYQWKKFHPGTAELRVTYNNAPRPPVKLNFTRPRPCGTVQTPTVVTGLVPPTFSAVASDPDNDNVTTKLSIRRADNDSTVYESTSSLTTSGAAFAWPQLPNTALAASVPYYYVASSNDGIPDDDIEFGAETTRCYFVLDSTAPKTAQLSSSDFPNNGEDGIPAKTTGIVTLRPGSGDTDVAEFVYGFQQDAILSRIKIGTDGTARLPVTVWPNPDTGIPESTLFVRAVDRAGNLSPVGLGYDLLAASNSNPIPRVRGDINGDGRADVSAVLDHGWGRTGVWNVLSKPGGLQTGTFAWDSGENGGYALYKTRPVQGDFDKDGRADIVLFREEAGRRIGAYLLKSDGNRYVSQSSPVWHSGSAGWPLSTARIISGDVNGDNADDIAVQLDNGNGTWRVLLFLGGTTISAPVQWVTGSGDWSRSAPLLADIDGDNKDDLVDMSNLGNCRTQVTVRKSSGTAFAATPVTLYDGSAYCWEKSKPVVADVNGDGADDIVAMYEHGQNDLALRVFVSSRTALTESQWYRGALDPAKAALSAGDYTGDGKDDAALTYALDDGGREVSTLTSTGTAFGAPVSGWKETTVAATTGPKFDIDLRAYELVARHSSKCLDIPGARQDDAAPVHQYQCNGNIQQRFRVIPIAGTDQFEVHTVHNNGLVNDGKPRCFDVNDMGQQDGATLLQWPCAGTANQQMTVEYLEGSSYDTVVRLRFAHSGKCAAVPGGSLENAVTVVQETCTAVASQQWILRPVFTGQSLSGRYQMAAVKGGKVLDIQDCGTNPASTEIRMWNWVPNSPCQRWQIVPKGDDIYQIYDPNSRKNVDVQGCPGGNASPVVPITPSDSAECQGWRIEPAIDGSWSILQNKSGRSLDVAGCSDLAGADVITWPYWNGPCQRWNLTSMN
ncbi:RICIN domain-containing protein [Kribbella sp. NPDC056345]|uniref:RICIN domain-containing protein n=1 Tax=Kribbella sp. NPDC056345 TaxID=3345789 RepID=UPI0035DE4824